MFCFAGRVRLWVLTGMVLTAMAPATATTAVMETPKTQASQDQLHHSVAAVLGHQVSQHSSELSDAVAQYIALMNEAETASFEAAMLNDRIKAIPRSVLSGQDIELALAVAENTLAKLEADYAEALANQSIESALSGLSHSAPKGALQLRLQRFEVKGLKQMQRMDAESHALRAAQDILIEQEKQITLLAQMTLQDVAGNRLSLEDFQTINVLLGVGPQTMTAQR